jgi:hypothetical protein
MSEWIGVLFFIGLLFLIADHNSKEDTVKLPRERSKSI